MTMASAQEFFTQLVKDEELARKIGAAADDQARMAIAQGAGFDFTIEELEAARDELDDTALDAVAGGLMQQGEGNEDGLPLQPGCGSDGSGMLLAGGRDANSWGADFPYIHDGHSNPVKK